MAKDETSNQVKTNVTPVLYTTTVPPNGGSGVGQREKSTANDGKGK